ncbi:unnamed protein product [Rodentolepis nana]|uniref:Avl9 domain-containing protein n=1 Tax=Rodentolepis nana TaxID=102285 RepID=A0A0R3TWX9_RODNA|nr:unnamed protein product [Rodentolepis nana]
MGILTKELIKLSATWFSESPSNSTTNSSPTLSGTTRSGVSSASSLLRSNTSYANIGVDADGASFEYQRMDMAALLTDCGVDMELPGSIAEQTKGIIFLSVPHRGNQSMMFLYHFPMVFTLTPEAKQLQQS